MVESHQSASSLGLRVVQVRTPCHSPYTPDPITAFFPVHAYTPRGRCFPARPHTAPTTARRGGCCFPARPFLGATEWGAPCLSHQRPAIAHRCSTLPVCAQGRSLLAFWCSWPIVPTCGCLATGSPVPSTPHACILGGHIPLRKRCGGLRHSYLALATARLCAKLATRVINQSCPFYVLLPACVEHGPHLRRARVHHWTSYIHRGRSEGMWYVLPAQCGEDWGAARFFLWRDGACATVSLRLQIFFLSRRARFMLDVFMLCLSMGLVLDWIELDWGAEGMVFKAYLDSIQALTSGAAIIREGNGDSRAGRDWEGTVFTTRYSHDVCVLQSCCDRM
jgi:hypothetical protein